MLTVRPLNIIEGLFRKGINGQQKKCSSIGKKYDYVMLSVVIYSNFLLNDLFFLDIKHLTYTVYLHLPSLTFNSSLT